MGVFKDYDELYACIGKLFDEAKRDSRIAPKIKDSHLIIQFRYDDPKGIVTINAAAPPTQQGAYFDVLWGDDTGLKPNVEMSMKADIAHQFWHGKINLSACCVRWAAPIWCSASGSLVLNVAIPLVRPHPRRCRGTPSPNLGEGDGGQGRNGDDGD